MPTEPTREPTRFGLLAGAAAACLLVAAQAGCTSALTTASLTNGLWQGAEHAAETAPAEESESAEPETTQVAIAEDDGVDPGRREAALEEAMSRLSRLGTLDPAVEAALVATLQRTQPEDWPVVVDEFVASLPATTEPPDEPAAEPIDVEPVASTSTTAHTTSVDAVADTTDEQEPAPTESLAVSADEPSEAAPLTIEQPSSVAAPPSQPALDAGLAVRSACFASAVRAWGDVDRFATDRFRPGQEVIVYVELDNLAVGPSPAGHTTCVDTVLRLVDDADHTLHTWTFEPIAETSTGRRRDYFARYVVRIPDSAPPGGCRVEMAITDTLAGATTATSLPLEIAADD